MDDAKTVIDQCGLLQVSLQEHREAILNELQRTRNDGQSPQIFGAWLYALDTMTQKAHVKKICSWIVEGAEEPKADDSDGGDITLRRV
jgi:hypothetical protein